MMMAQEQICWFGGANGEHGFISYYGELFSGLKYIYILKGGPGTGKSYLMRLCAEEAVSRGLQVEKVHCSSDALSLDGVIMREAGIGILDGTAPHMLDPDVPAIHGEILNLGVFWNREELAAHAEEIRRLCDKKAELYQAVYMMTGIFGKLSEGTDCIVRKAMDMPKLEAAARRLMRPYSDGAGFSLQTRQLSSVGMWGRSEFDSFHTIAKQCITVSDTYETGYLFLRALLRLAQEKRLQTMVSYHPICTEREQALYFPELGLAVTISSAREYTEEKYINMQRFLDRRTVASHRNAIRFLLKIRKEISEAIEMLFVRIRETHFELETYYTNAMDFAAKSKMERTFLQNLFQDFAENPDSRET